MRVREKDFSAAANLCGGVGFPNTEKGWEKNKLAKGGTKNKNNPPAGRCGGLPGDVVFRDRNAKKKTILPTKHRCGETRSGSRG